MPISLTEVSVSASPCLIDLDDPDGEPMTDGEVSDADDGPTLINL